MNKYIDLQALHSKKIKVAAGVAYGLLLVGLIGAYVSVSAGQTSSPALTHLKTTQAPVSGSAGLPEPVPTCTAAVASIGCPLSGSGAVDSSPALTSSFTVSGSAHQVVPDNILNCYKAPCDLDSMISKVIANGYVETWNDSSNPELFYLDFTNGKNDLEIFGSKTPIKQLWIVTFPPVPQGAGN